jgi:hypothetical protein
MNSNTRPIRDAHYGAGKKMKAHSTARHAYDSRRNASWLYEEKIHFVHPSPGSNR